MKVEPRKRRVHGGLEKMKNNIRNYYIHNLSLLLLCLSMLGCSGSGGSSSPGSGGNNKKANKPKFDSNVLPDAEKDKDYRAAPSVSGGTRPYHFSVTGGSLPPGLSITEEDGVISGKPTETGSYSFTLALMDSSQPPYLISSSFSLNVLPPNSKEINPVIETSTTKGVAPLSVFFDASKTTAKSTSRPFSDLLYSWNFGDPASRHPVAEGPEAAHVFEDPGSYTVTLTIRGPRGNTSIVKEEILVYDPDTYFAGANTICFSNTNDFTGAPSGSRHVITSSFNTVMSYLDVGKRLLLKRGDSFVLTSQIVLKTNGTNQVGAFGKGSNPDERGIYSNNPVIKVYESKANILLYGGKTTLMDLNFVPMVAQKDACIDSRTKVDEYLLLHLRTKGYIVPIGFSHDFNLYLNVPPNDLITIQDCLVEDFDTNGTYSGSSRLAFIGNTFQNCKSSHLVRLTYLDRAFIAENKLYYPGGTRHCLKIHAPSYDQYKQVSRKIVIWKNVFKATTPWPVCVSPQDRSSNEHLSDVIIDANTTIMEKSGTLAYLISGKNITLRNNILVCKGGDSWDISLVQICKRGLEPTPSGVEVYHNTLFNSAPLHKNISLVRISDHTGLVPVKNNLVAVPKGGSEYFGVLAAGTTGADLGGNVVTRDAKFVDPGNNDFRLKSGSPAINEGVYVPVFSDFDGKERPPRDSPHISHLSIDGSIARQGLS